MEEPVPLSTMTNPVSPSERKLETIEKLHHINPVASREDRIDITKAWKNIKATVCRDYEIPGRVASPIRVRVQDAPVGGDVHLEESPNIKRLAIELTISSVQEGQVTDVFVANTTGSPIKIKHGPKMGDRLLYDRKLVANPNKS